MIFVMKINNLFLTALLVICAMLVAMVPSFAGTGGINYLRTDDGLAVVTFKGAEYHLTIGDILDNKIVVAIEPNEVIVRIDSEHLEELGQGWSAIH